MAYAAAKGQKEVVVVDGKEVTEYDYIADGTLVFSRDGEHLAYAAKKGQNWLVILDGQEGPEYDRVARFLPARMTFDQEGALAYLVFNGGKLYRIRH